MIENDLKYKIYSSYQSFYQSFIILCKLDWSDYVAKSSARLFNMGSDRHQNAISKRLGCPRNDLFQFMSLYAISLSECLKSSPL